MTPDLVIEQLILDRRLELSRGTGGQRRPRRRRRLLGRATPVAHGHHGPSHPASARWASVSQWATDLAHRVAEDGIDANEVAVQRVLRMARAASALPSHTEVIADRSLPTILRERALGHVLGWFVTNDRARRSVDDAA